MQVPHSDIFCFGLYTPTLSPNYRNCLQNTTHFQQNQHTTEQIKVSCQGWVHSFPWWRGNQIWIFWGLHHFLVKAHFIFFFSSFNLPYPYKPSQNLNQSKWLSQPALHFISQPLTKASNEDLLELPLTCRPSFTKWHRYIQLHDVCQRKIKESTICKDSATKSQVHHAYTRNTE